MANIVNKIICEKQNLPSQRLEAHEDEQTKIAYMAGKQNINSGDAQCASTQNVIVINPAAW